jgi:hypothetical protein
MTFSTYSCDTILFSIYTTLYYDLYCVATCFDKRVSSSNHQICLL